MGGGSPLGIVGDIGGTHARFALAVRDGEHGIRLDQVVKLSTRDFASFEAAVDRYMSGLSEVPSAAVFAVASPIAGDEIKMTNNPWVLRPSLLAERLGLGTIRLVNDFEAIARAVSGLSRDDLHDLAPARFELPDTGAISVVGPGSGLGVGLLLRQDGRDHIVASEGGHIGFAPADQIEVRIHDFVRERYPRVSAERLVSGPGLVQIYLALAALEGRANVLPPHATELWESAIDHADPHARAAVERWLMMLGSFAGDMALAHGASAVVLAGGILPRLTGRFDVGPLVARFQAKGRFEAMMGRIPLALIAHPEPGMLGAARLLPDDGAARLSAA